MPVRTFTTIPSVIDAIELTRDNWPAIEKAASGYGVDVTESDPISGDIDAWIPLADGSIRRVQGGYWLLLDDDGFHAVSPAEFADTYHPLPADAENLTAANVELYARIAELEKQRDHANRELNAERARHITTQQLRNLERASRAEEGRDA